MIISDNFFSVSSPLLLAQSVDFTVLRDIAFSFAVASSSSVVAETNGNGRSLFILFTRALQVSFVELLVLGSVRKSFTMACISSTETIHGQ